MNINKVLTFLKENKAPIVVALFVFFSLNPFVLWIIWPGYIYIPVFIMVTIVSVILAFSRKLASGRGRMAVAFMLTVFMLHMGTPILGHEWNVGKLALFSGAAMMAFYPISMLHRTYSVFRNLMFFFTAVAVVVFFITLVGIELPHTVIPGFSVVMKSLGTYYKLYGVVVSSTNTVHEIAGLSFARLCGPFLEPGHFSIYLGFIILVDRIAYSRSTPLFYLALFLTLSPAGIVFIVLSVCYGWIKNRKNRAKGIFLVSLVAVSLPFIYVAGSDFFDDISYQLIGKRLESGTSVEAVLDDRAGKTSLFFYNYFKETDAFFVGEGVESLEGLGTLSDYRGLIFKYGLVGFFMSMILYLTIISLSKDRTLSVFLLICMLMIVLHRSWMFESPYIYIVSYLLVCLNNHKISFESRT